MSNNFNKKYIQIEYFILKFDKGVNMNLKKFRNERKTTQEEITKKLNIQKQTYQNYELGKREPSIEMLIKLADLFHTSVDNLIRDNKNEINNYQHPRYNNNLMEKIKQLNEYNLMKVTGYVENMLEEQNKGDKENK